MGFCLGVFLLTKDLLQAFYRFEEVLLLLVERGHFAMDVLTLLRFLKLS
jgi:hypothetical protein